MNNDNFAEYIWLDGSRPTQQLRSKARVLRLPDAPTLKDFPIWGFDGSSTGQATGDDSDCLLQPACVVKDPRRGTGSYLVLCEVLDAAGEPHSSNQRAELRRLLAVAGPAADPWAGFEQEYTIYREERPLGFPSHGYPAPQGPYYCGVGADVAFGRELADAHAAACVAAGLAIYGINAEFMPGQWEFQIGARGNADEAVDALTMADHLWLARFLLQREGERLGYSVSFANKPVPGDWNGAGMHTNFSTAATRGGRREAPRSRLRSRRFRVVTTGIFQTMATGWPRGSPDTTRPAASTCSVRALPTAAPRSASPNRWPSRATAIWKTAVPAPTRIPTASPPGFSRRSASRPIAKCRRSQRCRQPNRSGSRRRQGN